MYTMAEAAAVLGIDRKTVAKRVVECGIKPATDPRDGRIRLLSEDDVQTIREWYADLHNSRASSSYRPQDVRESSADLVRRVAELERLVAEHERLLAKLKDERPWMFFDSPATRASASILSEQARTSVYVPPARQTASRERQAHVPADRRIPAGTIMIEDWATQHKRAPTTVRNHVKNEGIPLMYGSWHQGGGPIKQVLTAEGQAALHRSFGIAAPCYDCGWRSDEDALVTVSADTDIPHVE